MQDRQYFEVTKLSNGITLYFHQMDVPFFQSRIVVPVGSAHSHSANSGLPGIAHFLEHVTFERSKRYPGKHEFEELVHQNGGYLNASTDSYHTDYILIAPAEDFATMFLGQCDQVFNPIFAEEDIAIQRGIISNERNQRRYYPGKNEVGQYVNTQWMNFETMPITQVLGSDSDLQTTSAEILQMFHSHYFSSDIQVVIGGNFDKTLVESFFTQLPVINPKLTAEVLAPRWVHKDYHEHQFKDVNNPRLWYGGLVNFTDLRTTWAIDFVGEFLTNHTSGPLNQWLRREKGWTYGLSFSVWSDNDATTWKMEFPVNELSHVSEIREHLSTKMEAAISNQDLIQKEASRRLKEELFVYQTLTNRMEIAVDCLTTFDRIPAEVEYRAFLNDILADPTYVQTIYQKYFSPEVCGSFLALPLDSAVNK